MIRRIVKMEFQEDKIGDFQEIFETNSPHIRKQAGCHELQLLQDQKNPHIFFTFSLWEEEEALDAYRKTELFGRVWKATKELFSAKPEAWSCTVIKKL